ncbi:helix-turn-helix transcriptional regulator [Blastococcus capsensis]|nr:helix-turn-helix transcriptional regulator [Blastococcus capsensis]MDK3258026.1 helix-turn-helix transcriptional regulator [Blastococcus capsensis]
MTDEDVLQKVGPRLRALRTERGATLTDVAADTGISVSTLSRLESGGRAPRWSCCCPWPGPTAWPSTNSSTSRRRPIHGCTGTPSSATA